MANTNAAEQVKQAQQANAANAETALPKGVKPAAPGEREALEKMVKKVLAQKDKRAEYQKKRNSKPEVKAERTEYNKRRYETQKALMKRAAELGVLDAPKKA